MAASCRFSASVSYTHLDVYKRQVLPLTAITANRLIEGIDQQDIDTFVTVLAALKENAEAISGE